MTTEPERNPEEIERDIERIRSEIGNTLNIIQEKLLSPGRVISDTLGQVGSGVGQFTSNLGRTARDNPVPAVLVGLGLGWLLMAPARDRPQSRREWSGEAESDIEGPEFASRSASDRGASAQAYAKTPEERIHRRQALASSGPARAEGGGDETGAAVATDQDNGSWVEKATKRGSAGAQKLAASVQTGIRRTRRGVRNRAKQVTRAVTGTFKDQPIAVGTLGLAIGVAIGAALPAMRRAGDNGADGLPGQRRLDAAAEEPGKESPEHDESSGKESAASGVKNEAGRHGHGSDEPGRAPVKAKSGTKLSGTATDRTGKSKA